VLGLDGRGNAALFADYLQWEQWRESTSIAAEAKPTSAAAKAPPSPAAKKKLSYMEQREFDGIDASIEAADDRLAAAKARIEDPVVATDPAALTEALAEFESAQAEHDRLLERWVELSEKAG
jgi:ATP-binding cassette subfamily F protein uup